MRSGSHCRRSQRQEYRHTGIHSPAVSRRKAVGHDAERQSSAHTWLKPAPCTKVAGIAGLQLRDRERLRRLRYHKVVSTLGGKLKTSEEGVALTERHGAFREKRTRGAVSRFSIAPPRDRCRPETVLLEDTVIRRGGRDAIHIDSRRPGVTRFCFLQMTRRQLQRNTCRR
jgi:hypothetical protein